MCQERLRLSSNVNECKPLAEGLSVSSRSFGDTAARDRRFPAAPFAPSPAGASNVSGFNSSLKHLGRGLHSFPTQLYLSSSVHRITQLSSCMCPGVAQVEL